jgi:hypothetical protein
MNATILATLMIGMTLPASSPATTGPSVLTNSTAAIFMPSPAMMGANLEFFQLNLEYDLTHEPYSDWGKMALTYVGYGQVMYLNVNVNGSWQIENMPLISREGENVLQTVWLSYGLNVPPGTPVHMIQVGADITDVPRNTPPPLLATAQVSPMDEVIAGGIIGGPLAKQDKGSGQKGGQTVGDKHSHKDFPNQEAGKNECVPAAISNSLKYLKREFGLTVADARISIAALKRATGWGPGGCDKNWWKRKKDYAAEFGIETRKLNPIDIEDVFSGIGKKYDVEMVIKNVVGNAGHCVAVVGAQKLANGNWVLEIAHDVKQGDDTQGTIVEKVTFDPNAAKIVDGPAWAKGKKVDYFVEEKPKGK